MTSEQVPFFGWVQHSDDTVTTGTITVPNGGAGTGYKWTTEHTVFPQIEIPQEDPVNHPKHYTSHPSGVECIAITRHMGYNLGNVVKYVWRADLKGKDIEDLEKAVFYLQDEIALRRRNK